jgi:hypothetical protein
MLGNRIADVFPGESPWNKVMRVGSKTFGDPLIQKVFQS